MTLNSDVGEIIEYIDSKSEHFRSKITFFSKIEDSNTIAFDLISILQKESDQKLKNARILYKHKIYIFSHFSPKI